MSQEYFHKNKNSISIFVKKWEQWIELYTWLWCMTKQNLLDQVIACMQSFTIWHAISKTIISQHCLPMEFCPLPGMACDIFAIFLQCKFLNSSTCTKQSRHKMWVKTLRMDCSPWIDKTNLIVEHVNPCGCLLLHVHPLQPQLCPPVCSSAHTSNYTLLQNICTIKWLNLKLWTLTSKISVTMAKLKQVSKLRDNIRCFLFEVHGAGVLLIQHHQCFHQDRNCDQPKK